MTTISVVMPNFNKGHFVESAIRSVLNQSFDDLELVLVDDGSTDTSLSIAETLARQDGRLRLLVHGRNRGVSAALNTGVNAASGEFVTIMGSDDLFAMGRVQRLVNTLRASTPLLVLYSDPVYINESTTSLEAIPSGASSRPSGMILGRLLSGTFRFTAGPITASKSCFQHVGGYDATLTWGEDFEMALRLAEKFPFKFDPLSTYGYRIYNQNMISTITKKTRWSQQGRILEKYVLRNYDELDAKSRSASLRYLFSCFVATGRWESVLRYGLAGPAGFGAMIGLPVRALRRRSRRMQRTDAPRVGTPSV